MAQLPSHAFLDERGIPYRRYAFSAELPKGAASVAGALGFRESQIVKSLVFVTDAGEAVLVLLAADRNAISGHLKRAIGSRNIRLADPDTVRATTGYAVGSIPPFHWQPAGFRSFVDAALMREEWLGVGAGAWGHEIVLAPDALVAAARAVVANLTDDARPVFDTG